MPLDTHTQQRLTELLRQPIDRAGQDSEGVHLLQQVVALIAGHTLVVIGGSFKERAKVKLEEAFACNVNWLTSKPHDPSKLFEPHIAQRDVLLVLLTLWSCHVFGDADALYRKHDKFLVRIQAGCNACKVASGIQGQVGERLKRNDRHSDI